MSVGIWLVLLLGLALGVGWALRPVRTTGTTSPSEAFVAAERHARRVTAVAWCVLIPVPVLVIALSPMVSAFALTNPALGGVAPGSVPLLAGVGFAAVHFVGELDPASARRPGAPGTLVPPAGPRRDTARALAALTAHLGRAPCALLRRLRCRTVTDGRSLSYALAGPSVNTSARSLARTTDGGSGSRW